MICDDDGREKEMLLISERVGGLTLFKNQQLSGSPVVLNHASLPFKPNRPSWWDNHYELEFSRRLGTIFEIRVKGETLYFDFKEHVKSMIYLASKEELKAEADKIFASHDFKIFREDVIQCLKKKSKDCLLAGLVPSGKSNFVTGFGGMEYGLPCNRKKTSPNERGLASISSDDFVRCLLGPNSKYIDVLVPALSSPNKPEDFCISSDHSADPNDWIFDLPTKYQHLILKVSRPNGKFQIVGAKVGI